MKTYYIIKAGFIFDRWYCMGMPWTNEKKEAFRFRSLRAAQNMALRLRGHNRVIKVVVKTKVKNMVAPVSLEQRVHCTLDLLEKEIHEAETAEGQREVMELDRVLEVLRSIRSKLVGT